MKPIMKHFAGLHPAVQFLYFTSVILFSMFLMHPAFLLISLFCGFICSALLNPGKTAGFALKVLLPLIVAMTVINPLINHSGATALLYINDNPITLEAVVYGAAAALMFASVLLWFSCSNTVMTSDKVIELFGGILPSLSLLFSMVLRFVPRFKAQAAVIANAQKGIGRGADSGNILTRAKNGMKILSMLTTWALENGVITADSMHARGYGLPKRSSFQRHHFDNRDKIFILLLFVLIIAIFWGIHLGEMKVRYYPTIFVQSVTPSAAGFYALYFLLCAFPVWVGAAEEVTYHAGL